MSSTSTALPYIVRVAIDSHEDLLRFEIPRTSTVDSLYVALSTQLQTTIQEAQRYELLCLGNETTIDPSMGCLRLAEVVKAKKGRGRTIDFVATKMPVLSFSFCVGPDSESESTDSDSTSDSDYTDTASESSKISATTETTDTTDVQPCIRKAARFYMNHNHDNYYDQIDLYREDDQIRVDYFYDRRSRSDTTASSNTFYGSIDEVISHMNHVFRFLAVDRKPYREVEVDIPFFPAMSQVPRDLLKKARRSMILVALKEFLQEGLL